ncbi:MAG: hypothetical protein MZU95_01475 [Desulfomicrobium escambiense]|nr:hypothetical protein [Desulfomicrobium escambiense]
MAFKVAEKVLMIRSWSSSTPSPCPTPTRSSTSPTRPWSTSTCRPSSTSIKLDADRPARLRRADRPGALHGAPLQAAEGHGEGAGADRGDAAASSRSSSAGAYDPVEPYTVRRRRDRAASPRARPATTARVAVDELRKKPASRSGNLRIKRLLRPFPFADVREHPGARPRRWPSSTATCSYGYHGIFAQEVKSALYGQSRRAAVFGFIAGLGGRDITVDSFTEIADRRDGQGQRRTRRSSGSESRNEPRSEKDEADADLLPKS